jgi:hypothetical protein
MDTRFVVDPHMPLKQHVQVMFQLATLVASLSKTLRASQDRSA